MIVYRDKRLRRLGRRGVTIARAVLADRARARATAAEATVDGEALANLIAEAAVEARVVHVAANRSPWTATGLRVTTGEPVTCSPGDMRS
jgi:hypothetical protein